MKQQDFEALLADTTKQINEDITWEMDEDHSPAVEFHVNVMSQARYSLFVKGSYNSAAQNSHFCLDLSLFWQNICR